MDLVFGSIRFPVHGCVIGSSSSYVNRILESRKIKVMVPKADIEVPVNLTRCLWKDNQFCQDCAEKVVEFMYFRRIQINEDHMPHIYALGDVLEIPDLLRLCKPSLKVKDTTIDSSQDSLSESSVVDTNSAMRTDSVSSFKAQCKADTESMCKTTDIKNISDFVNSSNQMSCLDLGWSVSDSANLSCPKCKDSFTNVFMLQQHCNTHLGKFYTCHMCNYSTLKVLDLLKHLKDANHMETVCSLCLYETDTNAMLKEHLNEHDHPQPFFCRTCLTRFQTRTALNSHIVKHSTETPFVCSVCGRGFKWKQGLQSHMNIHTSIKNHLCDQCGFSTAHLKSFQDHKIIHSGKKFKCPISACQFTSVRKDSVKHHLLTHSKEKPYQCEICGQAFSQAKNLRRHATTHDPSADAVHCPCCAFKTIRSDKLKDHFRRCHTENGNVLPVKRMKINAETAIKDQQLKELKAAINLTPPVKTPIFLLASSSSEKNEKCEQLFPLGFDKELATNLVLSTPHGGIVTLSQDQVNVFVCNPDGTGTVENAQGMNSLPSADEINKPLLIEIQVEDTAGSQVETVESNI